MPVAFIFGCARSGTSILGELVAAHPDVKYLYEAHHIWKRAESGEGESHRLDAGKAEPDIVRKVRKRLWSETRPGSLLVEKNPRHTLRIPFLRAAFPEAKLIHIFRDGRDVACSMLAGVGGEDWSHLRPPGWRELFERRQGTQRCAEAWKAVMEIALADLEDQPHLAIRYEDLVNEPQEAASAVLSYLELPPSGEVQDFTRRIGDQTQGSYQPRRQRKWFRDDHSVRVGRWRQNLSDSEAEEVQQIVGPLLDRLGYR